MKNHLLRSSVTGPWFPRLLCAVMTVCLVLFVIETRHWPLVGDSSLIHYLVFLMDHGMAPYRDIVDAQMPGTYLYDWIVAHTLGGGAPGLRVFDFCLMASAIAAMVGIAWPGVTTIKGGPFADHRYAAFLAGGLLALIHGRDGVQQAGQRDLIMAVLLLVAYGLVFHSVRIHQPILMAIAGTCAAAAITIKPTILPAGFIVFLVAGGELHRCRQRLLTYIGAALFGALVPFAAVCLFLRREQASSAFFAALHGMWPYYSTLQKEPLRRLLQSSYSPLQIVFWLGFLTVLLRILVHARREEPGLDASQRLMAQPAWENVSLYAGLFFSFLSYVAQRKGFPYHRYPFLAFLVLVLFLEFNRARASLQEQETPSSQRLAIAYGTTGTLGLLLAVLLVAPVSTHKISRFDWSNDDYYRLLSTDLQRVGQEANPAASLSGRIQCLDAYAGCINTLYRMGLLQSTGFTVDYYFWRPTQNAVTTEMRQRFWQAIQQNPPRVFVITSQWFPLESWHGNTFAKLEEWPEFNDYLDTHYDVVAEHTPRAMLWTSHSEQPAGYRIYVRRPATAVPSLSAGGNTR